MVQFGVVLVVEDKIIIQPAKYVEDGCVIEIEGSKITLYEIPYGGGDKIKIREYPTLRSAMIASVKLT